jgi:HEAT repeat protein
VKTLRDESLPVRSQAVYILGQVGPAARDAVPVLLKVVKDRDGQPLDIREAAVAAVKLIDPATAKKEGLR